MKQYSASSTSQVRLHMNMGLYKILLYLENPDKMRHRKETLY